ncbi:30979_t:CDS:2, partial [Racocetra persica]
NSTIDLTQIGGVNQGSSRYEFLLVQAQEGQDVNDTYTINLIRKTFNIRALILQVGTTCELPLSQAVVPDNSRLLVENVFEDINDLINSLKIEKQWCLTYTNNAQRNAFVQFNTGFFWFITALDINESLRHLKYMSDEDERFRYNLGAAFAPSHTDAITRLKDQINELNRKLEEDTEEHEKKK